MESKKCYVCGKSPLSKDEVGITKKLIDKKTVNFYCLTCLAEYFCSIMHELRSDMSYRAIVDELVIVPDGADTRDTEAVKRIATAYLKLLFPHVQSAKDIKTRDFRRYCLTRAIKMRDTIKYQLGLLDSEYAGKDLPIFDVREVAEE